MLSVSKVHLVMIQAGMKNLSFRVFFYDSRLIRAFDL